MVEWEVPDSEERVSVTTGEAMVQLINKACNPRAALLTSQAQESSKMINKRLLVNIKLLPLLNQDSIIILSSNSLAWVEALHQLLEVVLWLTRQQCLAVMGCISI